MGRCSALLVVRDWGVECVGWFGWLCFFVCSLPWQLGVSWALLSFVGGRLVSGSWSISFGMCGSRITQCSCGFLLFSCIQLSVFNIPADYSSSLQFTFCLGFVWEQWCFVASASPCPGKPWENRAWWWSRNKEPPRLYFISVGGLVCTIASISHLPAVICSDVYFHPLLSHVLAK